MKELLEVLNRTNPFRKFRRGKAANIIQGTANEKQFTVEPRVIYGQLVNVKVYSLVTDKYTIDWGTSTEEVSDE